MTFPVEWTPLTDAGAGKFLIATVTGDGTSTPVTLPTTAAPAMLVAYGIFNSASVVVQWSFDGTEWADFSPDGTPFSFSAQGFVNWLILPKNMMLRATTTGSVGLPNITVGILS